MKGLFMRTAALIMGAAMTAGMLSGCSSKGKAQDGEASVTLKLAEMHVAEHPITKPLTYFAQEVEEATDGRVRVEVCPAAQLGSETDTIEEVCSGELDMARVSAVTLSDTEKALTPMALPYLFRDREHLWNTINSDIGNEMLEGMTSCDGLAWLESGSRCFFFSEPVYSPEDMKGKKIRVPNSDIMNTLMESYGAEPKDMELSKVYDAIQNGEIDGAENDIISYDSFAGDIVAPNYIMDNHNFAPSLIIASNSLKDKLGESDYELLLECAKKAQDKSVEYWEDAENEVIAELKDKGVNFIYPDEQQMTEFRNGAKVVWDKYPDYADVIERIQKIK
jgi:tripartite ATP-independent transporter DctP family solute receptor